jgi:hypothetical protein
VPSERRWAEEMELNLVAYRWFLGCELDEATLNRKVLSTPPPFPSSGVRGDFSGRSWPRGAGRMIEGTAVFVDSTLVPARTSSRSTPIPSAGAAAAGAATRGRRPVVGGERKRSGDLPSGPRFMPSLSGARAEHHQPSRTERSAITWQGVSRRSRGIPGHCASLT